MEKSTTFVIKREHFTNLIIKNPQIALHMLATLSKRISKTDQNLGILRFSSAYGKVAKVLLDFSKENGVKIKNGIEINLKLSSQELADLAGLTRETASRIFFEFQKNGCIKIEEKRIILFNEEILNRKIVF